jgi:hypothetical protein
MPVTKIAIESQDGEPLFYERDYSLKKKLGNVQSLLDLIPPKAVESAEQVITNNAPVLLTELKANLGHIKRASVRLFAGKPSLGALEDIATTAFAVKCRAGFCGYPLIGAFARALHLYCEQFPATYAPTLKDLKTIACIIRAMDTVLKRHVTGDGGTIGVAIIHELDKLSIHVH